MKKGPTTAWGGDATLRRSVLDQMSAHLEAGRTGPVFAREATLQLYEPDGVATIAAVLSLPEAVLRLGYVLWPGFHDYGSEKQTIEEAREIYRALAPGADLTGFAEDFATWVLADPEHGLTKVLKAPLNQLAQDDADALVLGLELGEVPPGTHPTARGYLGARQALIHGEPNALALLGETRLAVSGAAKAETAMLETLRELFRDLGR